LHALSQQRMRVFCSGSFDASSNLCCGHVYKELATFPKVYQLLRLQPLGLSIKHAVLLLRVPGH
jgi:hypothetical protein